MGANQSNGNISFTPQKDHQHASHYNYGISPDQQENDESLLSPARQREHCQLSPPISQTKKESVLTKADRKKTPWVKQLDYTISNKVLGNGTFAQVHQAEHKISGEQVAAKVIIKSNIPAEMKYVIMEECNTIAQLDHPNVVRILSGYESPTHIYLMLPLMYGGDMHSFIEKNGRLTERTAFKVFEQLLDAVCHCHDRNIIHRDIKLENILLENISEEMSIQLTDFGFATMQRTSDPLLDDFPGSPAYAAPEPEVLYSLFKGTQAACSDRV